jgi:hypothetical protein
MVEQVAVLEVLRRELVAEAEAEALLEFGVVLQVVAEQVEQLR